MMRHAMQGLAGVAALCLLVMVAQMSRKSMRTVLGQDADWDVKSWTPEHAIDVKASRVDPTSVKGIWHSKKQAWAGIDRILPTGGRFGYEEYHNINGNQAKLANYMKHAENEIKTIEAHLPEHDKGFQGKEERKIKMTLDGERNGLDEVEQELGDEHVARDKSAPQMLAQVAQPPAQPRARQAGRVYADNVLYGEGIQGDIRSQGHHSRKWSRKGAEQDMDKYFNSLQGQVDPAKRMALEQKKGVHVWKKRAGDEMDEYLGNLQARSSEKEQQHQALLKREGYYHTHPEEALLKGISVGSK